MHLYIFLLVKKIITILDEHLIGSHKWECIDVFYLHVLFAYDIA